MGDLIVVGVIALALVALVTFIVYLEVSGRLGG